MNLYGNVSDKVALAGMIHGMNPKTVESYVAKDTVSFGKGVFINMDGKISNTKTDTEKFIGVAIRHQCEAGEYKEKESVGVVCNGHIWVVLNDGVEPVVGDTAMVKADGTFTVESSAEETDTMCGVFKSVAEDGLAVVEVNASIAKL